MRRIGRRNGTIRRQGKKGWLWAARKGKPPTGMGTPLGRAADRFGAGVVGFPKDDFPAFDLLPFEELWADLFEQVAGHVFRRRVVRQEVELLGGDELDRGKAVGVLIPKDEAMVPVVVDPALEELLEDGEVDQAADFVDRLAGDMELDGVVMAVKVLAFAAMAQ